VARPDHRAPGREQGRDGRDRACHVGVGDVAEDPAQQQDVRRDGTGARRSGARVARDHLDPGRRCRPRRGAEVRFELDEATGDVATTGVICDDR
jgi:hypothetical protein